MGNNDMNKGELAYYECEKINKRLKDLETKENANNEPKFRLNMKMTSKGKWYGEGTVRADTIEEATKLLDKVIKVIEDRSTVGGE